MRMTIDDIYALSSFENHNVAIKYLLPFWEKYRKIEQILKDIPYSDDATVRRIQEVIEDGNDR